MKVIRTNTNTMILFRPDQVRVKGNKSFGKWYARMMSFNTISTHQLARELSHDSSITEADIMGVISGLVNAIRQHLCDSETVHLDGLGTFRISLSSHTVDRKQDVNEKLIYKFNVVFLPEMKFNQTGVGEKGGRTGYYDRKLIKGAEAKRL